MMVKQYVLVPIAIFVFCLILLGLVYPLIIRGFSLAFKNKADGSPIIINKTIIGSYLISGYINNSAFFWPNYNNSFAFGYDPYITINQALSQINRISNSTGISKQFLKELIYKNSYQIEEENLFLFSPGQRIVNVMELNEILIKTYPNIYSKFLGEK
jgi:K+-transporting ATPase c subunit